jgi:hypothetical protein
VHRPVLRVHSAEYNRCCPTPKRTRAGPFSIAAQSLQYAPADRTRRCLSRAGVFGIPL